MSRWFRHYAGMVRDAKLVSASIASKQPIERVVWVWGAILESAAEIDDGGKFNLDAAEGAYFLRADEADICGIMDALVRLQRISDGCVVHWGDRQFTSDRSADRQARYRERKQGKTGGSDENKTSGDGAVASPSRHGDAPETETEAKTDKTRPPVSVADGARDFFDLVWEAFPRNPTSNEGKAEATFRATKASDQPVILAAAQRYSRWFAEDCQRRKRTVDAGLSFAPHLATWIETGAWKEAGALSIKAENSAPVVPMTRIDRVLEPDVWAACERLQGKRAPTSDTAWSFPAEVVTKARGELRGQRTSAEVH